MGQYQADGRHQYAFFSPLVPLVLCVGYGPGPHVGGLPLVQVWYPELLRRCWPPPRAPQVLPLTVDPAFAYEPYAWPQRQAIASIDKHANP